MFVLFPQSYRHLLALGDYMKVEVAALVGGSTVRDDVTRLRKRTPHVVIGTPGRIKHMIKNRDLGMSSAGRILFISIL